MEKDGETLIQSRARPKMDGMEEGREMMKRVRKAHGKKEKQE